ncbi:PMID: 11759840 [hydrothermal vent metagenome]|uniref:PMID: 11759840 n=1 Tax=hydrothermal vent metagenome TaxID=652676 RepID=A0A1W1CVV6_9ZZZZ
MWLKNLTGFNESKESIHKNITLKDGKLKSLVNTKEYHYGTLETLSLKELRERVKNSNVKKGKLKLQAISADVKALHLDPNNAKALFQVASQFNLLEMLGANITPEMGIEQYENDHTQGPICAICAGAGTIYRNYFVEIDGQVGQCETKQIDCLADIGKALGNENNTLWEMRNGYALLKEDGLYAINRKLKGMSEDEVDELREKLRIGLMWDTQVTLDDCKHRVSQAYCSALPVSYVGFVLEIWKPFASLILEATYEATICAGILNGDNRVYLTLVGGGVFGNDLEWICSAMERAILKYMDYELDVKIVNYGAIYGDVSDLIKRFEKIKRK